ncbi:glycosyl transferase family 90-domain-containing protein [Xylaria cf. heliscus]|nr:glycosyl transferase family 90-domain-containing protein [Xylaria cf. heliscus]
MHRNPSARVGRLWILLASSLLVYLILLARSGGAESPPPNLKPPIPANRPSSDVYQSLNLSEQECKATFPDLTEDLDATIALGPFTLKQAHGAGPLQARIKDGRLYIIHAENTNALSAELLQAREAALHQINRALITSPEKLPDTVFSLNIRDQPYGTAWSYSRPAYAAPASALPPIQRAFLMPHFAFWSWPLPSIGSLARAAEAVARIEESLPFAKKDPRVVWRGSARFNGVHHPTLRLDLLRATAGAEWADVRALDSYEVVGASYQGAGEINAGRGPKERQRQKQKERGGKMGKGRGGGENRDGGRRSGTGTAAYIRGQGDGDGDGDANLNPDANTTALMIEDFCRYKYVLYTDGVTYSGRLPFLQLCRSVLLTAPIAWRQHTTHLVRPLFSSDLRPGARRPLEQPPPPPPLSGVRKAWPMHYGPSEANAVFVAPDWSDLGHMVAWLEAHPDVAEGIARRQRDLFVGRGYLSPAMETCYWRSLIRGWGSVVRLEGRGWEDRVSVSWEEFSLGLGV